MKEKMGKKVLLMAVIGTWGVLTLIF